MATRLIMQMEKEIDGRLREALNNEYIIRISSVTLTDKNIPFLKGLVAGKVPGADELIYSIKKYGSVELFFR